MTEVQQETLTKRLKKGKARIEKGWCQFHFTNGDEVCLVASTGYDFTATSYTPDIYPPEIYALHKALPAYLKLSGWEIMDLCAFNNQSTTTKADILALYDRAIADSNQKGV